MPTIRIRRVARAATAPASSPDPAARRRWLALAVLAVAQFMVFLDETVVNVALPSIKASLGFSELSLAWGDQRLRAGVRSTTRTDRGGGLCGVAGGRRRVE
jgi:hypothetical protein